MGLSSSISNMGISQLGALRKQKKIQEFKEIATLGGKLKDWSHVDTLTKEQLSNLNSNQQNHLELIRSIHKKFHTLNKAKFRTKQYSPNFNELPRDNDHKHKANDDS